MYILGGWARYTSQKKWREKIRQSDHSLAIAALRETVVRQIDHSIARNCSFDTSYSLCPPFPRTQICILLSLGLIMMHEMLI